MADVFTVLAKDHQEVKNMLAELEKGPTRATGAEPEPAGAAQEDVARADHRRVQARGAGRNVLLACRAGAPRGRQHPGRRGDRARAGG